MARNEETEILRNFGLGPLGKYLLGRSRSQRKYNIVGVGCGNKVLSSVKL